MDKLLCEIREKMGLVNGVSEVTGSAADDVIEAIASRYVDDRSNVWWWEGLADTPVVIDYGDELGWRRIGNLVQDPHLEAYLLPTDDDPEPWPVFRGRLLELQRLLEEVWRFEYMIAAVDMSWLVFDTHHNSLMVLGSLKEKLS
jgi:hypothetical protein